MHISSCLVGLLQNCVDGDAVSLTELARAFDDAQGVLHLYTGYTGYNKDRGYMPIHKTKNER